MASTCAYLWMYIQVEFASVTGYIPMWFAHTEIASHPSTNRAQQE